MKKIDEKEFVKICNESDSMAQASSKFDMHFNTFKKYAKQLGCYETNQSGKGLRKPNNGSYNRIDLGEILEGNHPQYQTYKLKNRLFKEGIKQNKCEECNLDSKWNDKPINMELDHINGNSKDHRLANLKILCPNCHSQTDTFRAKNI
jgi:hypothetical protein